MIVSFAVVSWLIVLCVHDLRTHVLPNRLTVPAGVAAVAMGVADPHVGMSIIVLAAPYLVATTLGACGGGDLKLAVGLGGVVADPTLALLVVGAAALTTLAVVTLRGPPARRAGVAHGPALAGAAIALGGVWV
ncbi:A24 family peptidase [Williamsia maris]|uniref:Leader peptidase (Prepilin peptidase) / N-methyltransferase n=1 Tax=Williamsia maris TaxID=72806 RepID=A0ABT1HKB1_9NOCA|nr:A24 family peptidase [Williamsia maris]MCP2178374.1 leader peptidase (prepilin peptidase) / N-methyltransferase [Williamsia maris]